MSNEPLATNEQTAGGTAQRARALNTLPWLWLGLSAVWAVVIFATNWPASPLALWIATTIGPLAALKTRLDPNTEGATK